jgi:triacylglycerol esterase/lipase EstA (alpha/beta hydrolase family)
VLRVCLAVLVSLLLPAAAAQAQFAPLDRPGPKKLSVTDADLDKVLVCSEGIDGAKRNPVLLFQGTGATAKDNWSWTYEPALTRRGIPWCHVDMPEQATGDLQTNGELVNLAVRRISARAGRKVSFIGHSQGGMIGRWALRWWPDLRDKVEDVIGFVPSNHGTTLAAQPCGDGSCPSSSWQQWDVSNFLKALNSGAETFEGISYTNVITRIDQTVMPADSGYLRTGKGRITNVATQDVCPEALEHLATGTVSPTAFALAMDALDNDGPANPARIDRVRVCSQVFHEGVDRVTGPASAAAAFQSFNSFEPKELPAEPALRCYTTATCAPETRPACRSDRRFAVTLPRLSGLRVTLAGKALRAKGRRVVVDLRGRRAGTYLLRATGRRADGVRVTVERRYRTCAPRRAA